MVMKITDYAWKLAGVAVGALYDRLGSEIGLGKLGDGFTPTDLAVIGGNLGEAKVAQRVEVVRFGITDRNRFDLGNFHDGLS